MLGNVSLRFKLFFLLGVILIPFTLIIIYNNYNGNTIQQNIESFKKKQIKVIASSNELKDSISGIQDFVDGLQVSIKGASSATERISLSKNASSDIEKGLKTVDEKIKELVVLTSAEDNEQLKTSIINIQNRYKSMHSMGMNIVKSFSANEVDDGLDFVVGFKTMVIKLNQESSLLIKTSNEELIKTINIINHDIEFRSSIISIVSFFIIIIAIGISLFVVKNITSSLTQIQTGLQSFFSFLNQKTNKAELISLDSKDEFGEMAVVINNNISSIEKTMLLDAEVLSDIEKAANDMKTGKFHTELTKNTTNADLQKLKDTFAEVIYYVDHNVARDLNLLLNQIDAYKSNDFTHRIPNAYGKVAVALNDLGDAISTMLSSSLTNGLELQTEASTLKQSVELLLTSSNQQAASLEETAAAMEEMTSNVQNNVAKSNDMALMATQTDSAAREGAVLAQRTASAMTEIQSATNSINDAVAIIENIAFQTNILSLNAAVEAATAGDAGKGFAVVAQEVRNLANRSADAAKEIKAMASQAANKSNEGMNIATELTRGFEVIADKIAQTASMVQDVSNANREQMQGIGQINTAVTQLDQMTQENAKVAAQADSIANATISKAEAMVQDAQSKEFVGKNNIRAKESHTRASQSVQAAKPVVVAKGKYASNAIAKNSSKHESDVWENF